jgi:hypothetical protein
VYANETFTVSHKSILFNGYKNVKMGDEKVVLNSQPFALGNSEDFDFDYYGILGLTRGPDSSPSFVQSIVKDLDNSIVVLSFDE